MTDASRNIAQAEIILTLFETSGWRELVTVLKNTHQDLINDLTRTTTWEDTCFIRGQIKELETLIAMPDYFANAIDAYREDQRQNVDLNNANV